MKKFLIYIVLVTGTITTVNAQKSWTLKQCVDYALENSIAIKQSQLDRDNTLISKSDAIGSFLPTANISASHSWNIGLNQNQLTGLFETATAQTSSGSLNVGVDIFNGLQNINSLNSKFGES